MPQFKKFLGRLFGNHNEFEFQVLKSTSAVELVSYGGRQNGRIPRSHSSGRAESKSRRTIRPSYYSHYDDLAFVKQPDPSCIQISHQSTMDNVQITFIHVPSNGFGDKSMLSHISEEEPLMTNSDDCNTGTQDSTDNLQTLPKHCPNSTGENLLKCALATCHWLRLQSAFSEGILLKAIDYKSPFPFLHYAVFKSTNPATTSTAAQLSTTNTSHGHKDNCCQGSYNELYSIVRKTSPVECHLPSNRFTGFIVISYKLLPEQNNGSDSLQQSWLNWTGAREIYKYCPREWNLKRITLHRCSNTPTDNRSPWARGQPFQFVLLCEFSNLLNPKHFLDGCETVERLKARRTGLVGLYQVQWVYEKPVISSKVKDFDEDVLKRAEAKTVTVETEAAHQVEETKIEDLVAPVQ